MRAKLVSVSAESLPAVQAPGVKTPQYQSLHANIDPRQHREGKDRQEPEPQHNVQLNRPRQHPPPRQCTGSPLPRRQRTL